MNGPIVSCSTEQSLAESKSAHAVSLAIHIFCPAIAAAFVALRIWSRSLMRTFGWDDGLILIALLLSISQSGAAYKFTIVSHGGYHVCDVPPMTPDMVKTLQEWLLIQQLLYNPILAFVKASVLLFLLRFQDKRWFIHRTLQAFFGINIALGIAIFLADLFQCTPVRYMYDFINMDVAVRLKAGLDPMTGLQPDGTVLKAGTCIKQYEFVLSTAAVTTFTEALTMLIPMAMVWDLKIARKKKIAVVTILSLGWIVVAISIARIVIFARLIGPRSAELDASYGAHNQISTIEVNLAIIVACAPALKALTKRFAPRFLSSRNYGNDYKGGYSYGKRSSRQGNSNHGYGSGSIGASGRPHRGSIGIYGGRSKDMDVTVIERTESQEEIIGAAHGNPRLGGIGMGIEKTVQIDIEMDDLRESDKGQKEGHSVRVSGRMRKGSSTTSSEDWGRI